MIHVLYHANCFDGIGAAWAVFKKFGYEFEDQTVRYYPMYYNSELDMPYTPDEDGFILVDYSRPYEELFALSMDNVGVVVLDHHKSAEANLKRLEELELPNVDIEVDMSRSGAVIAWEFFHPEEPVPKLLQHIQDRDLWKFEMNCSKQIHAYLCSRPKTLEEYEALVEAAEDFAGYTDMISKGAAILEYNNQLIEEMVSQSWLQWIGGYHVPCANVSLLFSEVPHRLLEAYPDAPFASYVYRRKDCYQYGLRGRGDFDVSAVAKKYGGGGHYSAAGFELREPIQ